MTDEPTSQPAEAAPFSPREAMAFEHYAGVTAYDALDQVRAGRPSVKVCVGLLWVTGWRINPDLTPDDVLDSYETYGELFATAVEQLLTDEEG